MLGHYFDHPPSRRDRLGALMRIFRWQSGRRTIDAAVAVHFVDGAQLPIRTGMHGATGNVYVGLMEYEDMAFALHLLRKVDAFLDVGANVGVYSILGAGHGAKDLAIEPIPATYEQLLDNMHLNRFQDQIDARNMGVGGEPGELRFSTYAGPINHVLVPGEADDDAVTVAVSALDTIAAGRAPTMIKIDVEGFEANVIRGAAGLLAQNSPQAVLIALEDYRTTGNTLYVRPSVDLEQRLREARPFVWRDMSI